MDTNRGINGTTNVACPDCSGEVTLHQEDSCMTPYGKCPTCGADVTAHLRGILRPRSFLERLLRREKIYDYRPTVEVFHSVDTITFK